MIKVGKYDINYKISGAEFDETIIILQGWNAPLTYYDGIAQYLSKKYRVVQFDFPGFGASPEPDEPLTLNNYVHLFECFCEKLDIKQVILIGHSFGGRIIIDLMSNIYRDLKIKQLFLIDAAGIKPKPTLIQSLKIYKYKFLKKIFNLKLVYYLFPVVIDDWFNNQGSADYKEASDVMKQCLINVVNIDLTSLLKKINVKTTIIWGKDDKDTPIEDAHLMHKHIKTSELFIIEKAGHYPFLDKPDEFYKILDKKL